MAWSVPSKTSASDWLPGSRLTFVIRMSGMRAQPPPPRGAAAWPVARPPTRPPPRFARGQVAGEQAVPNDVGGLRGHALIVECKRAQPGTVLRPGVGNHVHNLRTVAQAVQPIQCEEAHARVVGLAPQHAVEL